MPKASQNTFENRLLASLPQEEYSRLVAKMEPEILAFKQVLYEPNESVKSVYFPTQGVVSLVTIMQNDEAIELATVGNEGMVGLPVFLGTDSIPGKAFVQVPGTGLKMKADVFKENVPPGSPLHDLLQRYTQTLFNQIAQSAACNRLHSVEERLCRWLLMTQDRVKVDTFPLTQEFMAQMLGVRRPTVSLTASILQKAGLIHYVRGKMHILDREGLEESSCECHGIIKAEYERLLGGD